MVVAWAILAPAGVLVARYFKVLPWQDFPAVVDSKIWWHSHWMGQTCCLLLTIGALIIIYPVATGGSLHGILGYSVIGLALVQVGLGIFRGSKGGPTDPAADGSLYGDHYNMTLRRRFFEFAHKFLGYSLLILAVATILVGLWHANAPRWMWVFLTLWWCSLTVLGLWLQAQGRAVDTYQAIWGPSPTHPGNVMADHGWGMRRKQYQERAK